MNLDTSPLPYEASILADSVACHADDRDVRLTTFVVNFPRIVLAEFNTHRVFSRNSASSRAIPVKKRIKQVDADPFIPLAFGKNKKGMQSTEELDDNSSFYARDAWLTACQHAIEAAQALADLDVHKQFANRLLEPFGWHTVIVTATEWDNFWALRDSEYAQPEIALAAKAMRKAYNESAPVVCWAGDWHLPLVTKEERSQHPVETLAQLSTARCARVSYMTHDKRVDVDADLKLYHRLTSLGHMSPLEHPARVDLGVRGFLGNFRAPWVQLRKTIDNEDVFAG